MFWGYITQCFRISVSPAWNSATGYSGNLIAIAINALTVPIGFFIVKHLVPVEWSQEVSFTINTLGGFILLLLFRILFIAPYQLYRQSESSRVELALKLRQH